LCGPMTRFFSGPVDRRLGLSKPHLWQ
jgi:hypothetical protein